MGCLSSWENRTKPATGEPKNGASVEDLLVEVNRKGRVAMCRFTITE